MSLKDKIKITSFELDKSPISVKFSSPKESQDESINGFGMILIVIR